MANLDKYSNISMLFEKHTGDSVSVGEEMLSEFKERDLEDIDQFLSVVNFDQEPTEDWVEEFNKKDLDRTNSAFAEILLLYHLRENFGGQKVDMNAKITSKASSKDFDLKLSLEDETWIEIVKRDWSSDIPEGGGFMSAEGTEKTIDCKLKDKFEEARKELSGDETLILGVYLEEMMGQSLEIGKWLSQEYYDVSEFCDGLITFSHLAETRFDYYPFTEKGEEALDNIESELRERSENFSS